MLARRLSYLALRSLGATTNTLGNASAAVTSSSGAAAARYWSERSISGIHDATTTTTTSTSSRSLPLLRRLFSSDAIAEDAVSPRLTDKSLLQTGAFIGGEFVDAGRSESATAASSSSSSSSSSSHRSGPLVVAAGSHQGRRDGRMARVRRAAAAA